MGDFEDENPESQANRGGWSPYFGVKLVAVNAEISLITETAANAVLGLVGFVRGRKRENRNMHKLANPLAHHSFVAKHIWCER